VAARPILLTGARGLLGRELRRTLATLGPVAARDRAALDLADAAALRSAVRDLRPALIVNAGAYTAVDRAESEPEAAHAVNAVAPGVLADAARAAGTALVHFSTDYVFDGRDPGRPLREDDPPAPLGIYGRSKLAGERAVAGSGAVALVLRLSWVYAREGRNFLTTMARLARERDELRVVADQRGAPTWARLIAEATAQALASFWRGDAARLAEVAGLYHLAAAGETTWHGFATAIVAATPDARTQRVVPIATSDYPVPAARPAYSVLDSGRFARTFGLALPPWEEGLALCLSDD